MAIERYDAREQALGEELMGALERFLLLQIIDERWREHLFDMDYLREGIHLRGFAQIDPLVAYKNEAFTLFGDLMNSVWADYARMIFNVAGERRGRERRRSRRCRPSRPAAAPRAPAACPTRAGAARSAPVRWRRPRLPRAQARRAQGYGGEAGGRAGARGGRAARGRRGAPGRAQRPLLVRERQEVQEVPRRRRPLGSLAGACADSVRAWPPPRPPSPRPSDSPRSASS